MNIYSLQLPSEKIAHAYQPHTKMIDPGTPVQVLANPGHWLPCFINGKAVSVGENSASERAGLVIDNRIGREIMPALQD
jgi:hypothetical protein